MLDRRTGRVYIYIIMKGFLQVLKFTAFSVSAGVIQFVTTGLLSTWTGLIPYYWVAYLIGLVLSVIWNFTFNRKFTFASAGNVPLAMVMVVLYYCAFTPVSTFGADAIVSAWKSGAGWNDAYEMVITALMMIINFVTEFIWDKFVVFNDKVMGKIEGLFKRKKIVAVTDETAVAEAGEPEEKHPEEVRAEEVQSETEESKIIE